MKLVGLFLLACTAIWAIDIDMDYLKKEISQNPKDVKYRLIIAKSYVKDAKYDKAQKLLEEVLKIEPKNQKARFLIKDIKKLTEIESFVQNGNLSQSTEYFKKLYDAKKYDYIILKSDIFKRNNIKITPEVEKYIIASYIQKNSNAKAIELINTSSIKPSEKHLFMAKIAEKNSNFPEAEKEYKQALENNNSQDAVIGLYDLYKKEYKTKEAQKLADMYKNNKAISKEINKRVKRDSEITANSIKEKYKKDGTFSSLKQYYYTLESNGNKLQALKELKSYVNKNTHDDEARLFLAQNLSWAHHPKDTIVTLNPVINKTRNKKMLKIYVDSLLATNQKDKAYKYMERLASLGDSKSKSELDKLELNDTLATAVAAHKLKDYPKAIKYYKRYYSKTNDAKIAKEIAELSFVTENAKDSLGYYEAYLRENPQDNRIKFRYATALDSLKMYNKSEPIYKSVAQVGDELQNLATYRYASSLIAQKNEAKWNFSRGVLQNLLERLESQSPSKKRDSLLKFTKATLKKVSVPMPKPTRHKDIILAEGQKKILDTDYTLVGVNLQKRSISSVKSMIMPINKPTTENKLKDITLSFHSLDDDTINNISYGVKVNNIAKVANGTLSIGAKRSTFKNEKLNEDVDSFITSFNYKNFSVGVRMSKYKDFNDVDVELSYRKIFAGHDITVGLKNTNGAFVNSNACSIENKINVVQLSFYDAILLKNLDQAEIGLTLNRYDDENINLNSWLEYPIYNYRKSDFSSDISFSGSYEFNTKTDTCYYSSEFFDGNYIQARPKFMLGKKGYIQGIAGIGYSFENDDVLYNYGASIEMLIGKFIEIRIDCRHYQSGYSPVGADECYATAAYKW